MQRSLPRLVRQGGVLKGFFGGSKSNEAVKSLTVEEKERLQKTLPSIRAKESVHSTESGQSISDFNVDELLDNRLDTDAIRARGFLKYHRNYTPAADIEQTVISIAKKFIKETNTDVKEYKFEEGNNKVKFELLTEIGDATGHWPTNSKITRFDNVADVIEFYKTPVKNITKYVELARDESKPSNIHMLENAVRFHPNDTNLYHKGVTAFPGTGGKVYSLRQKRLLRQFQPKQNWFDYEDQTFDYQRADKDMPWDPEIANQMDNYADKRYNLKTKKFTRIRQ